MTDATYRIEVRHDPHSTIKPYVAWIYRLSDDHLMELVRGTSAETALSAAREWVAAEVARQDPDLNVLVDDLGRIVRGTRASVPS